VSSVASLATVAREEQAPAPMRVTMMATVVLNMMRSYHR
jgi:hypothetical protein